MSYFEFRVLASTLCRHSRVASSRVVGQPNAAAAFSANLTSVPFIYNNLVTKHSKDYYPYLLVFVVEIEDGPTLGDGCVQ